MHGSEDKDDSDKDRIRIQSGSGWILYHPHKSLSQSLRAIDPLLYSASKEKEGRAKAHITSDDVVHDKPLMLHRISQREKKEKSFAVLFEPILISFVYKRKTDAHRCESFK